MESRKLPLSSLRKRILLYFLVYFSIQAQENYTIRSRPELERFFTGQTVSCFFQDQKDFLWIGTTNGVYRYDGNELILYRIDNSESTNMVSYIKAFYEDPKGRMFALSYDALLVLNKRDFSFERIAISKNGGTIRSRNDLSGMIYLKDDTYLLTTAKGFVSLQLQARKVELFPKFSEEAFIALQKDKHGAVYLLSKEKGLFYFNPKTEKITRYDLKGKKAVNLFLHESLLYLVTAEEILLLRYDSLGNMTLKKRIDFRSKTQLKAVKAINYTRGLIVQAVKEDKYKYFLFSYEKSGIFAQENLNQYFSQKDWRSALFLDKSSVLWFGASSGLKSIGDYERYTSSYELKTPIRRIRERENGNFYVLTENRLFEYNSELNQAKLKLDSKGKYKYAQFIEGPKAYLWLSERYAKLRLYRDFSGHLKELRFSQLAFDSESLKRLKELSGSYIVDMLSVGNRYLLFATFNGLYQLDMDVLKIKKFKANADGKNTMTVLRNDVSQLRQLDADKVFLIYHDRSFSLYSLEKESFQHFNTDENILPFKTVSKLIIDKNKELWFSSEKSILYHYRFQNSRLEKISSYQSEALYLDNAYSVSDLVRKGSYIYYNDGRSIARYNIESSKGRVFSKLSRHLKDGIRDVGFFLSKNNILFASGSRLIRLRDDYFASAKKEKFAKVNSIYIKNPQLHKLELAELPKTKELFLDHATNSVTFTFSTRSYQNQEDEIYQYRLVGVEDNWIEIGRQNKLTFTGLEAGDYRFEVKTKYSEDRDFLTIDVKAAFFESKLFFFSLFITILLIVVFFYFYRKSKLREIKSLRTQLSANLHDDIGASLAKISLLSDLLNYKKDFHYAEKIKKIVQGVIASFDDIVWFVDSRNDSLEELIDRMKYNLIESCQDTNLNYELDLKIENPQYKLKKTVRENVFLIFKEALNNSLKYAKAKTIFLSISQKKNSLVIKFRDDGYFENSDRLRRGNGKKNMLLRAKQMKAKLEIKHKKAMEIDLELKL